MGTIMLIQRSNGSSRAYLGFRLGTDTASEKKSNFLQLIFHKLAKRVTTICGTAGKKGLTRCATSRSTGVSPPLAVPVRY